MAKKHAKRKPNIKQKKIVLERGEVVTVVVPKGHTPLVATEKQHVEVVPVKKKKGWWETFLYGEY
jgi:hypothetical protein